MILLQEKECRLLLFSHKYKVEAIFWTETSLRASVKAFCMLSHFQLFDFSGSQVIWVKIFQWGEPGGGQVSRDGNCTCGIHPAAKSVIDEQRWVSLCVCKVLGWLIVYQLGILSLSIYLVANTYNQTMITPAQELGVPVAWGTCPKLLSLENPFEFI